MSCGSGGWNGVGSSSGGSHRGIPPPGSLPASSRSVLNRQPPRHIHHGGNDMVRGVYPKMGECVVNGGENYVRGPGPADPYRTPQVPDSYPRTSQEFLLAPPPPPSPPHRQQDLRLGPSQHTSSFYRNGPEEDHKSESPSRKRQRLVCSPGSGVGSHHHHHHQAGSAQSIMVNRAPVDQRTRVPQARHVAPPPPHSYPQPPSQSRLPPHTLLSGVAGMGSSPTRGRQYYGNNSSRLSTVGLASQRHHHHHQPHQPGRPSAMPPLPPHYPSTSNHHQPPTVALALDVTSSNLVPVTLSLPLYTNVAPPAPPPTLPPCQMPSIIWAAASASTPPSHHLPPHHPPLDMLRGGRRTFGECPHHHHHHHHHGGGNGGQNQTGGTSQPWGAPNGHGPPSEAAVAAAAVAAALRATPPTHFPPPPADSFELEIIVDQSYHRRAPVLQVSTPGSLAAASGILLSGDVPRRPPPPRSRWPRTLPPPPPPVPGLFHFLTMITSMNDALSPIYPQRDLSHEPFPDNYEELLSLAERLGDAKPRGLTRSELDKLPSYIYDPSSPCGEQTSCVVCMCDFDVGHTLRKLHCCHMFHSKCVDKWLKANRTCPICRRDAAGNPPKVIFNTD